MLKFLVLMAILVNVAFSLKCKTCTSKKSMEDCKASQKSMQCSIATIRCYSGSHPAYNKFIKGCLTEDVRSNSPQCKDCKMNTCEGDDCNARSSATATFPKSLSLVIMLIFIGSIHMC